MVEVYDFKTGQAHESTTGHAINPPFWDRPEQEAHTCAVVRQNPRRQWAAADGRREIEAPLHYATRIAHLSGLLPDVPEPYHCGKAGGCHACDREPLPAVAPAPDAPEWWNR